ncbi:uncharacterized protein UMAG_12155 [Mycosarcoma maydis]|uniref:DNA mismatch repair proteins mutS family domain-containing protein n=1 Tax=Mycosarcoma maydis TaxID=5270 RepID=A0A0D1ECT3_MYCMD|nr:uncharacterized protein UMAG_12155 [Ustilago maydis 521]KIS72050.1 hypothetical protein UMAG_12155 [Ustilago maydis 521]WJN24926.1 DNA mismatch repair protein [Ustilago maydis]|eukprot:XP_011386848.1 hypothetical protein UMAG_12155 [Ustilago maydis 521]
MSTVTHSQALGSASETIAAASFPVQDDTHASVNQQSDPTSALAIEVLHGRMGCAVYLNDEQQLLLCEELPCAFAFDDRDPVSAARDIGPLSENPEPEVAAAVIGNNIPAFGHPSYGLVGSLLSQFRPELVVVSSRCPESLRDMLLKFAEQHRSILDVRPAKFFQVAVGLSSLEEATVFSRYTTSRDHSDLFRNEQESLSARVVLDAKVAISKSALSVAAVGPLLSSLRTRGEVGRSLTLVPLCLDDHLFLDENTLKSLNICSDDVHGFVHAKRGREGFSILVSQSLLRRWLMLPLANRLEISRRHEAVELLVRLESTSDIIQIRSQLAELGGVPQICYKLNMGVGSASTWAGLLKTCNAIIAIRNELNGLDLSKSEMLHQLKSQLVVDSLQQLTDSIGSTIDFEMSKEQGKVTVRPGVDTHLDELREQQLRLPQQLDRVASDLRGQPAFRPTTRQIGYLICVPGGEMIDMLADPTLEQQFASDEYVYLKNSRMTELDFNLGDIASFIVDKEIEILDSLQSVLQKCSPVLLAAHAALCQIDCLIAFARAATLYDLKKPNLVEKQVLRIKGSRHALKALSDESFVPNDIELHGGLGLAVESVEQESNAVAEDVGSQLAGRHVDSRPRSQRSVETAAEPASRTYSLMVLTGANSSGKSCLLQQAALAVYLCQCGSFVPAASAELGVFDKILTRMRQDESVASEGSSFTRELGRLHRAMAISTKRSLVILDEVGRECRSDDGAGLFIATIYEFLERGIECPIVLSATHHLRAIERHLPETLPIQRAHMQTLQLPTLTSTDSTLTYLYRLRPGFAGTSHACHCARLCGVPESVVERADRICRIGLRAWHDSEARRNEAVVRRLIQLDLGNEEEEERDQRRPEMDDDTARKMIRWVLEGDFDEEERTARVMSQIETERAAA